MGNEFIQYLNSMNNAASGNENALAESQVTNKYYNYIHVERKLGKYIVNGIKSKNNKCYILTGHAGDGKTSILVQVLRELNILKDNEKLKVSDTVRINDTNLTYVKDMSELSTKKQYDLLKQCLEAPKAGGSSIIISNTGPLIKSLTPIISTSEEEVDDIEDIILKQLDLNELKDISINGYSFELINIARIENISFASEVINKICADNLWIKCESCRSKEKCPIYFNKECVSRNKKRVVEFIETYYRWLDENDNRITIRQMISQISYAFTGNLTCKHIEKFDYREFTLFNYNFANLFFGYRGILPIDESKQIKGVDLINKYQLDSIALNQDYKMFIKNDFSDFDNEIKSLLESIWKNFIKVIYSKTKEKKEEKEKYIFEKQAYMRRSIRRFMLIYGESDEEKEDLYNQLFGKMFNTYIKAISEKQSSRKLRKISDCIFQGLYIKNVGVPSFEDTNLYLTLRRNDEDYQNVLFLLGKLNIDDLKVVQVQKSTDIEDTTTNYKLELYINGGRSIVALNLPLLSYFYWLCNGEVTSEINPSLSYGLDEINSKLLNEFRFKNTEDQMILLVNTLEGCHEVKIEFNSEDDEKLCVF